ncbi:MAG: DNA-3-methyladenine glycosylase [candidate division WS1 bacterium]|jgi:DNA-3-methyladenine glycosylase|nr:DNA-3-methyladenine glycosylase [candidate division WS1 bacterium]
MVNGVPGVFDAERLRRCIVPVQFYARPAELVALNLLGKLLVKETPAGLCVGRIVETEAYLAFEDHACHAARGKTPRNSVMWEAPATAYVYMSHGHWLLNAVTGAIGLPEAALIRALEPMLGIELMRSRRGRQRLEDLASGPGKLTQALGIDGSDNRTLLHDPPMYISRAMPGAVRPVTQTTRIGLGDNPSRHLLLRYYYSDSRCVSVR